MAGLEYLDLDSFHADRYSVLVCPPGGTPTVQISQEVMDLAKGIRQVHHRTQDDLGAVALAENLMRRPGIFYMVHDLFRGYDPLVGYAYVEPGGRHREVARVSSLEAFNTDEGRDACRVVAAAALLGVMEHRPSVVTLRVDGREIIREGRSKRFFMGLGMGLGSEVEWGRPGAYMLGSAATIRGCIRSLYDSSSTESHQPFNRG